MPEPRLGAVPFTEAIEYFRRKINLPTQAWSDLQEDAHARAFVVAGATKADLLADIRAAVDDALAEGTTITDFRKRFDEIVERHGWSYRGKRGWRTRVMFDTNIRTAHAAGRWQQIQRTKERRPWLIYQTAGDERVRPLHQTWHHITLPADDPWWDTHYPPNGWGCRCIVRTASDRTLEREGLEPTRRAPAKDYTERVNVSTGEVLPPTPKGIDTGWGYNVGKAHQIGPAQAFGQRVMTLPRDLRPELLRFADQYIRMARPGFRRWAKSAVESDEVRNEVRPVGFLSNTVIEQLLDDDSRPTPASALVTISDRALRDIIRPQKSAVGSQAILEQILLDLPGHLRRPRAVLWDKQHQNLVYVWEVPGESRYAVLPVNINHTDAGQLTQSIRSGGLVSQATLSDSIRYGEMEGSL